jgi:hypothetical protein
MLQNKVSLALNGGSKAFMTALGGVYVEMLFAGEEKFM